MALRFGPAKGEDVVALITKKNYAKAIELLKEQLQKSKADPRVRLQLADVLVLARKEREAVTLLVPLADEYAREGFAAKAVSVLKKIQKIDPGRRDVEQKLASVIQEKQRVATVSLPPASGSSFEIGMEEIGMDPPAGGPEIGFEPGPELGMAGSDPSSFALAAAEPAPPPAADVEPPAGSAPPPSAPPPPTATPVAAVVDTDFFTEEDLQLVQAEDEELPLDEVPLDPVLEAEPVLEGEILAEPEPEPPADPMSDGRFADELIGLVDQLFEQAPAVGAEPVRGGGQQIVVSPLFQDLEVDEMVAVIAGLKLLTFERGDVIIRQGRPGDSLYMLTSGKVRAFVKNAQGKNRPVADLDEGAFFGEGSILTGKPRSATVAALTSCELLELDRPTLDDIVSRYPHVLDVLREFAQKRQR
jgi:hypothetical protein